MNTKTIVDGCGCTMAIFATAALIACAIALLFPGGL